jgi:HK97 family phage major capsid protein
MDDITKQLENQAAELTKTVETKLEEKGVGIKTELEKSVGDAKAELQKKVEEVKIELEADFEARLTAHKQEIVELSKSMAVQKEEATEIEKIQLQKVNSCQRDGEKAVSLESWRKYQDDLTAQIRNAARGEDVKLDATIAGFAGYDDARGGALIATAIDPTIRQDFTEHDMGLFNLVNFEPAMSPMKKIVVDVVEPDVNTNATKESLEAIGYQIDDGCFVTATASLKDYFTPARITHNQTEDPAFRVEPYVNGKLAMGSQLKIAKDIWVGNSAQKIKGIINYPQGTGYGKVGIVHVNTAGVVTMADIMKLCSENKNKGALFIDKATWGYAVTERKEDGEYIFALGNVAQGQGAQPFKFDAIVPFLNVPVVFDDAFTLPEAVAANVRAAILPPSAVVGIQRPTGRLTFKNEHAYKEIGLTERYDAVLTKFTYVKLLLGTQAEPIGPGPEPEA